VVTQAKWSPVPFHLAQTLNSNSSQPYIDRTPSFVHAVFGVIGGMGFDATCDFVQEVHHMNPNLRLWVDQNTNIPGRTEGLKGDRSPVVEELFQSGLRLHAAHVKYVAIPCNTSHAFLPMLKDKYAAQGIPMPHFIEMPAAVVQEIARESIPKRMPANVMTISTEGTRWAKLYPQAVADLKLSEQIHCMAPEEHLQPSIDAAIDKIKAGNIKGGAKDLGGVVSQLPPGIHYIVGACTEIPIGLGPKDMRLGVKFISSTHVLAKAICAVAAAKYQ
jgi:aspartate racemase